MYLTHTFIRPRLITCEIANPGATRFASSHEKCSRVNLSIFITTSEHLIRLIRFILTKLHFFIVYVKKKYMIFKFPSLHLFDIWKFIIIFSNINEEHRKRNKIASHDRIHRVNSSTTVHQFHFFIMHFCTCSDIYDFVGTKIICKDE